MLSSFLCKVLPGHNELFGTMKRAGPGGMDNVVMRQGSDVARPLHRPWPVLMMGQGSKILIQRQGPIARK